MTEKLKTAPAPKPAADMPDPETTSHIPIHRLYTPGDLKGWDQEREVGYPGEYPFTRGVQATMYRGRLWTMRQYAGMGDAEESNKRYKYLLANGTTGLSVAFDLPTQIGLDSDNPLATGEVGKVGVAIDSIEDMERLFSGIDLTKISTSMTINATASILLALYVAVARRQGADIRKLSGTVQNDVLKEYIARGTYIYPPHQAMRIIDFRLPHARSRIERRAGGCVYPGRRDGLRTGRHRCRPRRRQVRTAHFFLLQCAQQFSGRSGEIPGGPPHVGTHYA
jgi:methylmalonyl-CoA mutase N-terminal domain/subunit